MHVPQPFILASASIGRAAVLKSYGVTFEVQPSSFDETQCTEKNPVLRSLELAREKAFAVAKLRPEAWIAGLDTVVVAENGGLLEKPPDAIVAERMLRLQSGATSAIHTALCLVTPHAYRAMHLLQERGRTYLEGIDTARVKFRVLDDATIDWWITSLEWAESSGAFKVRESEGRLIEQILGDETTVIGFPMRLFQRLLKEVSDVHRFTGTV